MPSVPFIIDGHCHLASSRCIPRAFFEGVAGNMVARMAAQGVPADRDRLTAMLQLQYADHDGDLLVSKMDQAGIERTVLLSPDFTWVFDAEETLVDLVSQHAMVRARHPGRFHVFMGVDPRWGRQGYDIFERSIDEHGFEGLKVYPPCGFSPSDKALFPLYEICAARGLPVLLHTGPTTPTLDFRYANPYLIDEAAMRFPTVNFILAHGGVNFAEEARLMCHYRPNVYLDISGFPAVLSPKGWRGHLADLFALGMDHKIIFGTDWPVFSTKDDLHAMTHGLLAEDGPMAGLADSAAARIMGGNIQRLLPHRARTGDDRSQAITTQNERLSA